MDFMQSVSFVMEGTTRSPITVEAYGALDEEEQNHYEPDYLKHRPKKIRKYDTCYECGDTKFVGWETIQVPVGGPYRYVPLSPLTERMIDSINRSNVLMARVLGNQLYGENK